LLAKGEYIMFADADDYVEPTILSECEAALNDTGADFACVAFDRVDVMGKRFSRDQSVSKSTVVDVIPENVTKLAFLSTAPWGKLFRSDLLTGCTFPEYPISVYEDCIFMLSLHPRVKRYVMIPNVLYHYLVHDEQDIQISPSLEKSQKFRKDMVDLRSSFETDGVSEPYMKMLDIATLIHVGIADVHRVAENRKILLKDFCAGAKSFMNEYFPGWKKIKLRPYGKTTLRCTAVWAAKQMYKLNIFWIFIRVYNKMIKTLHVDVKW